MHSEPLEVISLPAPALDGPVSLEQALARRRSVRAYTGEALALDEVSQLLWAAQGITEAGGAGRSAPSAGGTYPLEVYVAAPVGLLHYLPQTHRLEVLGRDDLRLALAETAPGQEQVRDAAAVFVLAAVTARTGERYGERAERYVALEAGHAAQNLLLQAVALGLGAVPVGAFGEGQVRAALNLPSDSTPLYLIPVGHPAGG